MPLREAARVACLSRAFLRSWRCHPKLIFNKDTIGLKSASRENFHHKITRVLRNHSGISLKTLEVDYRGIVGFDGSGYLDGWLQTALKPGIEELTLSLSNRRVNYKFPCSLLSDGVRNSLRYLKLHCCDLRPTVELGPLRTLTSLQLCSVRIKWNDLECILSNSLALEHLELAYCLNIICLKIPCALKRLNSLRVEGSTLKLIESKAPNLSSMLVRGHNLDFSFVETLQLKKLSMQSTILDAHIQLPSIMPNLETLVIESRNQVVDGPMLPSKFLYLKNLTIRLQSGLTISQPFDYLSLVSFLDASPSLEIFRLDVRQQDMIHESISADSQLRDMPERRHGYLKSVEIIGFSSAKSLAELTCYILENAVALECLTLDTVYGHRCGQGRYPRCFLGYQGALMDAPERSWLSKHTLRTKFHLQLN
ncbi:hypothetical protein BS78_07G018100 [Paspalum vaginatum]|nr:hypothetical protein BS78_07G018100 [Paspalum vaginatum]